MSLHDDIQRAVGVAMKAGDTATLGTLRLLWSGVRKEEIDTRSTLDDAGVQKIISRQIKQLLDSIVDFEKGGRSDLVAAARAEINVLQPYLPQQLTDEELEIIVRRVIGASKNAGKESSGKLVGLVMKEAAGKADGARVRAMVEKLI